MEQLQKHLRIEEEIRIRDGKRLEIESGSKVNFVDVNKVGNKFGNKYGNKRKNPESSSKMIPRRIRLVSIARGKGT